MRENIMNTTLRFGLSTFLLLAMAFVGCSRTKANHYFEDEIPFAKGQAPRPNEDSVDADTDSKIREFIEQLASKNSPQPIDYPEYSRVSGAPSPNFPNDWDENHQKIVDDAQKQLTDIGKPAFPILLEFLGDRRYSKTIAVATEHNLNVGQVCKLIVERNVDLIGIRYKSREGADGKTYMSQDYFRVKYPHDIKRWWHENYQKPLKQARIDVLKWTIEREEKIGFPKGNDGKWRMDELRSKLAEIEAEPQPSENFRALTSLPSLLDLPTH